MKSIGKYFLVLIGTILFTVTGLNNKAIAKTISMSQYEVLPYMGKDLPGGGPLIHFIKSLFESMGHEVKITWFPHKRAYMNIMKERSDCSAGWNKLPERESEVLFSDTILFETVYLYHLKSNEIQWESIGDLKGQRIGIKLGAAIYGNAFFSAVKKNKIDIDYALNDIQNLKKLFAKRIEIVPLSKINAGYFLKSNFSNEEMNLITFHPKPLCQSSFHLIFSNENKPLMEAFNAAFLKAGGRKLFNEKIKKMSQSAQKAKK